jgi:hypothetical protein
LARTVFSTPPIQGQNRDSRLDRFINGLTLAFYIIKVSDDIKVLLLVPGKNLGEDLNMRLGVCFDCMSLAMICINLLIDEGHG